uniref:Uncharacterized protein n=1 Tax=Anguilla anguilla TaxID=7936 RepID=A0A0E9Q901_ANGAN
MKSLPFKTPSPTQKTNTHTHKKKCRHDKWKVSNIKSLK